MFSGLEKKDLTEITAELIGVLLKNIIPLSHQLDINGIQTDGLITQYLKDQVPADKWQRATKIDHTIRSHGSCDVSNTADFIDYLEVVKLQLEYCMNHPDLCLQFYGHNLAPEREMRLTYRDILRLITFFYFDLLEAYDEKTKHAVIGNGNISNLPPEILAKYNALLAHVDFVGKYINSESKKSDSVITPEWSHDLYTIQFEWLYRDSQSFISKSDVDQERVN